MTASAGLYAYPAFDIDGVVADLVTYTCEQLGLDQSRWTSWSIGDSFGEDEEMLFRELMTQPEVYVNVPVYHGAADALHRIIRTGKHFCFLSCFDARFYTLRWWWLEYVCRLPPRSQYWLHRADSRRGKAEIAVARKITHLLDDSPVVVQACIDAGVQAYLCPRPWNADAPANLPRATLDQYVDLIINTQRGGDV